MQERRIGTQSANESEEAGEKHQAAERLAINAAAGVPRFTKVASFFFSFLFFFAIYVWSQVAHNGSTHLREC